MGSGLRFSRVPTLGPRLEGHGLVASIHFQGLLFGSGAQLLGIRFRFQ